MVLQRPNRPETRSTQKQLSPAEVHGQLDRVVEQLREPFLQVAELLADAAPDLLAFTAFPVAHWQKLWSNNPQERLNREIRRRRACPRKGTWWASSPSLLEPRRRSEKTLLAVIQQAYVEGVSTRRVDDLIKALGCDGICSQVSRICQQLDEVVESFLGRPLDGGPYPYVGWTA